MQFELADVIERYPEPLHPGINVQPERATPELLPACELCSRVEYRTQSRTLEQLRIGRRDAFEDPHARDPCQSVQEFSYYNTFRCSRYEKIRTTGLREPGGYGLNAKPVGVGFDNRSD